MFTRLGLHRRWLRVFALPLLAAPPVAAALLLVLLSGWLSSPGATAAPAPMTDPAVRPGVARQAGDVLPREQPPKPLGSLLNQDGTLDLNGGFSGSLDPSGWEMVNGPGGEPHFVPVAQPASGTAGTERRGESAPAVPGDEYWDTRFGALPGVNNRVWAVAISGSDVYVGGDFTAVGLVGVNHIARWNTTTYRWYSPGSGVNARVYAIAVVGSDVYASGDFTTAGGASANRVARWNTNDNQWYPLGSGANNGANNSVFTMAANGSDVYMGGTFTSVNGVSTNYVARWNIASGQWYPLGSGVGGQFPYVNTVAVNGSDVYVGGDFTTAGGVSANYIARWNIGSGQWYSLGSGANNGTNDWVYVIAVSDSGSDVYAGGGFTAAGGVNTSNIARWNTSSGQWYSLGTGANNGTSDWVHAITASGNDVYVGGAFTQAGGVSANYIARWNIADNQWYSVSYGIGGQYPDVYAITVSGSDLYMGGNFTTASGQSIGYFARYDGNDGLWHPLGNGPNGAVLAVAVSGNDVYIGGNFNYVGGVSSYIARWNTTSGQWYPLGNGVNGPVYALAVSGSDVYVGGAFTIAGGVYAYRIARWNTSSGQWYGMYPGGVNAAVRAITVSGSDVYVGGDFDYVYSVGPMSRIARWNTSNGYWYQLGGGVGGGGYSVYAIAVSGSSVYVGGTFTNAGGVGANNIARWNSNNSQWYPLDDGFSNGTNSTVAAIVIAGSSVYVGGNFTQAGGVSANYIARWNTARGQWYPLDDGLSHGLNNPVSTIVISGTEMYVGGSFTQAGGIGANHIARWNTNLNQWYSLGSGTDNYVSAIAIDGNDVHVGGGFTSVGDNTQSYYFGIWHNQLVPALTPTPTSTSSPVPTETATFTSTPVVTPIDTPTDTPTPTAVLVGHVTWQGRGTQPGALQVMPITLTLKLGTTEVNYPTQNTDASGFFTVPVTGLPNGTYSWRVKGPKYLANTGTVSLIGSAVTNAPMGLMRAGDCNNDNLVNINDFSIMKPAFGRSVGQPGYDDRADFTGDQIVNVSDFNFLKGNFGLGGAPPVRLGGP